MVQFIADAPCSGSSRSRRAADRPVDVSSPSAPADTSDAPVRTGAARTARVEIQRVYDAHQQVRPPESLEAAAAGRRPRGALHRGGLMRAMGLAGAVRGRAWVTTTHAGEGGRPVSLTADSWPPVNRALGLRFHGRNLGRLCLRRVRYRCLRDALWAGGCRPPCARTLCWMRWSRRSTPAGATPSPASYITVMPGRNISRCGTRIASWTPASRRRSAAKAMPMTMPSPNR